MATNERKTKKTARSTTATSRSATPQSEARKSGRRLVLKFVNADNGKPELDRIEFRMDANVEPSYLQRGDPDHGFSWTEVSDALAVLFLDFRCWNPKHSPVPTLSGSRKGSLAASLGDALHQPKHGINRFLEEAFQNKNGSSWQKLFSGDNIHGRSSRGRRISIKHEFLPQDCVEVYWGNKELIASHEVVSMLNQLRGMLDSLSAQTIPSLKQNTAANYFPSVPEADNLLFPTSYKLNETSLISTIIDYDSLKEELASIGCIMTNHYRLATRGLSLLEKEFKSLAYTTDLESEEQTALFLNYFQQRSELCQRLAATNKVIFDTCDEIKRFSKEHRQSLHDTLTGEDLEIGLKKLRKDLAVFDKWAPKVNLLKEVDFISTMIVKKIRRVSIVDNENKFVGVGSGLLKANTLHANRDVASEREKFLLYDLGEGIMVLMGCNKCLVSADLNLDGRLISNRHCPLSWERFEIREASGGYINLINSSGKYVGTTPDKDKMLKASSDVAGKQEQFRIVDC